MVLFTLLAPARRIHPRVFGLLIRAVALVLAPLMAVGVFAAPPHLIGSPHPYDPDWPTVFSILTTKCIGCHRPGTDHSDLSTYEAVTQAKTEDGTLVVAPGSAEYSLLWEYLAWNAAASGESDLPDAPMMPPDEDQWLSAGQLDAIRRWINNGALQFALPATCRDRPLTEIDFPSARICAHCHPKQHEEWSRSMHAYAMHSPVFEAFNLTLVERTSGTIGTFCTRCHSPLGTALGENGSRRAVNRSRLSLESVTCVVCHRRNTAFYKNNGRFSVQPGQLHEGCFYGPFESNVSQVIGSHESRDLPYIKTSQFCGECHDVVSPNGVRNEEAFSEWQRSPAAEEGITCQLCHMGPVQGVPIPENRRPLGRAAIVPGVDESEIPLRHLTDHTFAGPDYSLLPDTEFPHRLDWMYEADYRDHDRLTPHQQATLRDLRLRNRASLKIADEKRYELLRNAARIHVCHPKTALAGRQIEVRVDVQSIFAGHNFPTGFTAERQVWISLEVLDPAGRLIFTSGDLDHNQDLRDEHSHDVLAGHLGHDKHLLNFQNKFTAFTNRGTERSVVISVNRFLSPLTILRPATGIAASFGRAPDFRIAKGSLPPLTTIGQSYPVKLSDCAGACRICVRLNFRHLPPTLLNHVGTPHLNHLLEIVVLDDYHGVIHVSPAAGPGPRQGVATKLDRSRVTKR